MRALVVDDDPTYRTLMVLIINNIGGFDSVREAATAEEAIKLAEELTPDFCAIDWMLEDSEGIALGTDLLRINAKMKMALITAFPTKELPRDLIRAGFSGYVDKSASIDRVAEAIREVIGGGMFFASTVAPVSRPPIAPNVEGDPAASISPDRLSPREREIVVLVASGQMSKEIAFSLGLSPRTVDKHRGNILRKLGLHDVASLTRWCLRVGLLNE